MKIDQYVHPGWNERLVMVIASGPSLTERDCQLVKAARERDAVRVISVSNAFKYCAPWADAYYAADRRYWMTYFEPMRKAGAPLKEIWTCCSATAERCGVRRVRTVNKPGLGVNVLHSNSNSGAMGVGLAVLFGAKRICMLGFDMQLGPNGRNHFDGPHPAPLVQSMPFNDWIKRFDHIARDAKERGITILNASRSTALTQFKRVALEDLLQPTKETT